jgi:flagellar basal-body rod protein FlgC
LAMNFDSLNISASGLTAERLTMDIIANNIANANTTRTPEGGPYRREVAVLAPMVNQPNSFSSILNQFTAGQASGMSSGVQTVGVQVAGITKDQSPFKLVYDPSNPDAVNGYVQMPNVDVSQEMVDMISASRAYEANVTAFDAGKQMNMDALSIGK